VLSAWAVHVSGGIPPDALKVNGVYGVLNVTAVMDVVVIVNGAATAVSEKLAVPTKPTVLTIAVN
jgi:hypothetical protein